MLSKRLKIRRFESEDLADVHDYLSDDVVVKYEPYAVHTYDESHRALKKMSHSANFWAICLKETGQVIGQIYLSEQEQNSWELGYVFNRKFQKQGYASEAVSILLDDVFNNQGAHRISAMCNPENENSWKLLERAGFRKEGHLLKNVYFNRAVNGDPLWQDTYLYGMLKNDFIHNNYQNQGLSDF
ncbi:GNAT family N-acetyltransferase [Enterococcus sp. BWT-B8]|uniref:GNAT family N-acetyltransferase n=1 Tax=Enterococcus sp. BWT-B8 TaxID=2885157 RepID=UPI001E61BCBB|nr:GNAT family N-acetyltransferase [Enterococcus sp. BWT-B8]MCB5950674.1 GNAT family N-acetyltransferase [Enterococcus sp. BWT-B8]